MHARVALSAALVLAFAACRESHTQQPLVCSQPAVSCGLACVDLETDFENCGSCGHRCVDSQTCVSGVCECGPGTTLCGPTCSSLLGDPANCGTCGNACGTGQACLSGACGPASCTPETPHLCNGTCVNVFSDDLNCGSCGHVCTSPLHCVSAWCVSPCPAFAAVCGGETCAYLTVDDSSCGACGVSCAAGTACSDGACVATCSGEARFGGVASEIGLNNPLYPSLGDLDGDGHLDLVYHAWAGGVFVARGLPDGRFATPVKYSVSSPVRVALADFDKNGKLDVAVAKSETGAAGVAVMLNAGDGTLLPPVAYAGATPLEMSAGDLDADGDADLAILTTAKTVEVRLNAGNGTFAAAVSYALADTVSNADEIEIGDVTGDGKPDLVVGHSSGLSVFPNQGGGAFAATATVYPLDYSDTPDHMKLADMDGDGRLDVIATTSLSTARASVLWNGATGAFSTKTHVTVAGLELLSISAADIDGDGDQDLVAADIYRHAVDVIVNLGAHSFAQAVEVPVHDSPTFALAAPLDGDALPDLLAISGTVVDVYPNAGGGELLRPARIQPPSFQPSFPYTPEEVRLVEVADLDLDGKGDLMAITPSGIDVAFGNGDGTFGTWTPYPVLSVNIVVAADMTGDGWPDIVYLGGSGTGVGVLANQGDGTFTAKPAVAYSGGRMAVGDVDDDGKLDVVASSSGAISFMIGNGDGTLKAPVQIILSPCASYGLAVADLNADGMQDIVQAGYKLNGTGQNVCLFRNKGGPTLYQRFQSSLVGEYPTVGYPVDLAVSDVNGDGKLDVAVIDDGFSVFRNTGTTLARDHYEFTGLQLRMADLNGDHRPDAVVSRTSGVAVSLQGGDGTFGPALLYSAGRLQDIALGDLDGDRRADVLTANRYTTNATDISVLLALCR